MAELAGHERDVESGGDEHRGVEVSERVNGESVGGVDPSATYGGAEAGADGLMQVRVTTTVPEHEVVGRARMIVLVIVEQHDEGCAEDDFPLRGSGLEASGFAVATELLTNPQHTAPEVHITPAQAETFPDPQTGVREEFEDWPVRPCVVEHVSEIVAFQNRDRRRFPLRSFTGFQKCHRVFWEPSFSYRESKLLCVSRVVSAVLAYQ